MQRFSFREDIIDYEPEVTRSFVPNMLEDQEASKIKLLDEDCTEKEIAQNFKELEKANELEEKTDHRKLLIRILDKKTENLLKNFQVNSFEKIEEKILENFSTKENSINFNQFFKKYQNNFFVFQPQADFNSLCKKHSEELLNTAAPQKKTREVVKSAYSVQAESHQNRDEDANLTVNQTSMGRIEQSLKIISELCDKIGALPFFHCVVKKDCFNQTIENIFDISNALHSNKIFLTEIDDFEKIEKIYENLNFSDKKNYEKFFLTTKKPEFFTKINQVNSFTKQKLDSIVEQYQIDDCIIPTRSYGAGYIDPDSKTRKIKY